jgi:hypothetical protein
VAYDLVVGLKLVGQRVGQFSDAVIDYQEGSHRFLRKTTIGGQLVIDRAC